MARVLNFCSVRFKCMCSYCFCPVKKPAVMNQKLLERQSASAVKTLTISALFYLPSSNWNLVYFQNVESMWET